MWWNLDLLACWSYSLKLFLNPMEDKTLKENKMFSTNFNSGGNIRFLVWDWHWNLWKISLINILTSIRKNGIQPLCLSHRINLGKNTEKSEGLQGETLLYLSHLAFLFPVDILKVVEQKWINQAMPTKADLDVSKLAIWLIFIEYK